MAAAGAQDLFQDHSGVSSTSTDPNPYNALIEACEDDPSQIKSRYDLHRLTRAKQQRAHLLSPDFPGVNPEAVLRALLDEEARPPAEKTGYVDPRHCLVFWARPPERVRQLVREIQDRLRTVVPNMWFMPPPNLHLTALEIAHSLTPSALAALEAAARPLVIPATDILHTLATGDRKARLSSPMLMFDASAVALSFLPSVAGNRHENRDGEADKDGSEEARYTYHHLRRDIWDLCSSTSRSRSQSQGQEGEGVPIASRYIVPSCHLTVGRFVSHLDTSLDGAGSKVDAEKMREFVETVDGINAWLEKEYWSVGSGVVNGITHKRDEQLAASSPGEWTVGEEVGLELRKGTVWYGGGESVRVGRGIES